MKLFPVHKRSATVTQQFSPLTLCFMCLLLVVLASCGDTGNKTATHTSTPRPQPTPTATPTSATTPTPTPALQKDDWPTYHHDNGRSGYLADSPDPQQLTRNWSAPLDGAVYAEPLVVKGNIIAATENDTLYAIDPTGKVLWQKNVGQPVLQSTLPCGDINPLGITGTPVYDPTSDLIFAVAEVAGPQHILIAVDTSGNLKWKRVVDVPSMKPRNYQQRSALALYQGMVYIAFGGLAGDCADYRGTIVAARTDGQGDLLSYQVPTTREAGMWAPSGPAIDANGKVYVAVGNGEATGGTWDHSDSVLRFSPSLQLEDGFAPTNWAAHNSADADLGSIGPLLLPDGLIFIEGKTSTGFLLHADKLGGIGGQAASTRICPDKAMGGAAAAGSHVIVPCTDGVRSLNVGPGTQMTVGWQGAGMLLPPVIGGHTVYSLDYGGTLYAANLDTGALRAKVTLTPVPHFATPTVSGNHVFVGTLTGIEAVTIS